MQRERVLRERLEFLAELNRVALAANDYRSLMRAVTAAAVPELGDWCTLHFVPEPGGTPEVEVAHTDVAKIEWAAQMRQRYPFDPDGVRGIPAVIRTGRLEFLREIDPEFVDRAIHEAGGDAIRDELLDLVEKLQLTSVITVPLNTNRRTIGAMQFVSAESGRVYDHEDVALAQAAAGRIAEALDNVWLTEQHRLIATKLQAALLPPRLPEVDGLTIAAWYWAAGAVSEVGGDFYDAFAIDDRKWAVVIGDVCGTGPDAAAVTAIARHTIRAAATHGHQPAEVLSWLNDALARGQPRPVLHGRVSHTRARARRQVALHGHVRRPPVPRGRQRERRDEERRLTRHARRRGAFDRSHARRRNPREGGHRRALHRRRHRCLTAPRPRPPRAREAGRACVTG